METTTRTLIIGLVLAASPALARAPAPGSQPTSAPAGPGLVQPAWSRDEPGPDEPDDPAEPGWMDNGEEEEDPPPLPPTTRKKKGRQPEQAWCGSRITWGHAIQPVSYSFGAQTYDRTRYHQLLSFEPALWPAEGLRLGLRLALAFDLSPHGDETDSSFSFGDGSAEIDFERLSGPAVISASGSGPSDLHFDASYSPRLFTVPGAGVRIEPGLRVVLPLSAVTRARSRLLGLAPGLALRRRIELLGPFWLPTLDLVYAFRAYKYFHEYETTQLGPWVTPESGRNTSWHIENAFELRLQLLAGLHLALAYHHFDDLLYALESESVSLADGVSAGLGPSANNHRSLDWLVLDLGYDLLSWLRVSAGFSMLFHDLVVDSSYRASPSSRETVAHINLTLPMDRLAVQVRSWIGG